MAINLGSTAIADVKLGTTQVDKIYLGSEQVWGGSPTPTDPDYGEVVLYGYSVTPTSIENVTGGTVTVQDEDMLKRVFQDAIDMGGLPLDVTVTGDSDMPSGWTVTTAPESFSIDEQQLSMALTLTPPEYPFEISFTLASVGSTEIDTTTTSTRVLASAAEFNQYTNRDSGGIMPNGVPVDAVKEFTIGTEITSVPNDFLFWASNLDSFAFPSGSSLTTIGNRFLGRTKINSSMSVPVGVTSIGSEFLSTTPFNSELTLPNTLLSIGAYFLTSAVSFNQPIVLPSSLTSIGDSFMYSTNNMTNYVDVGSLNASIAASSNNTFSVVVKSLPAYTTGITIKGANRSAWISRFPNRTSLPYRKLIDGGA